jgi:hypothetical protein
MITPGPKLSTRLVTGYSTMARRLWITLPSDFHIFEPCKHLADKQFATDTNMKQAVTWLHTFDTDFHYATIQALVPYWEKKI